jgi:hypothetical protein
MKTIAAVSLMLATSISGMSMMSPEPQTTQIQSFVGTVPAATSDEALPPTF